VEQEAKHCLQCKKGETSHERESKQGVSDSGVASGPRFAPVPACWGVLGEGERGSRTFDRHPKSTGPTGLSDYAKQGAGRDVFRSFFASATRPFRSVEAPARRFAAPRTKAHRPSPLRKGSRRTGEAAKSSELLWRGRRQTVGSEPSAITGRTEQLFQSWHRIEEADVFEASTLVTRRLIHVGRDVSDITRLPPVSRRKRRRDWRHSPNPTKDFPACSRNRAKLMAESQNCLRNVAQSAAFDEVPHDVAKEGGSGRRAVHGEA